MKNMVILNSNVRNNLSLLVLFLIVFAANGQSIETTRISFKQTLFPKKKLPANITTYNCVVTTPYLKDDSTFRKIAEEKYQRDMKDYPNTVKNAEIEFKQNAMPEYEKQVAEAKERYKLENDAYNKMTLIERLALIDEKPALRMPDKPRFYAPAPPFVESVNTGDVIIYNPETLAKNYININGFREGPNGMQINIDFKGFQYLDPVATVVDMENYNPATKEKFYTKQTQYVTKFRHPTSLKVKADNAGLFSGIFKQTADYQVKTTSSKPERLPIEREEVISIIKEINKFLNDEYGYVTVYRDIQLYSVKNKKGEYDDVEKAKGFAVSGYKNYTEHQIEAIKDIQTAVDMWEKTMTEVDFDNSKARIDEKVGMALLKNLIVATIITNQFEKAEKYLGDFKNRRLNYDEKQFLDYYEKVFVEMKSRANG